MNRFPGMFQNPSVLSLTAIRFRRHSRWLRLVAGLVISASLTGCTHWVSQAPAPAPLTGRPPALRLVTWDGSTLILDRGFRLERDTVFGPAHANSTVSRSPVAVPVADVRKFQIRKVDPLATTFAVAAGTGVVVLVIGAATAPSDKGAYRFLGCTGC